MEVVYLVVAIPAVLLMIAIGMILRNGPPASRAETERDLAQLSSRSLGGILRGRTMSEREAVRMIEDREAQR